MTPALILTCFLLYTAMLFIVTWYTSRKANSEGFYRGNKRSPWFVVAYGMIGASLSGVTFMSVPGYVGGTQFGYLMVVVGYLFGYFIIANVLLPLYYRLNLTSIYTYLDQRFGFFTYKTGAFFFLLSRTIGASLRMFLVVFVLQRFVFDALGVPFWASVIIFITLIILYTLKGGIKTIIWTDMLQTTFMLLAVGISIILITNRMDLSFTALSAKIFHSDYSNVIITDWASRNNWIKQFFSGMFITIVMTGLDQEMMQKNLSCRNLKEAKKNMISFSFVLVFVNFMFLFLGAALFMYVKSTGVTMHLSGLLLHAKAIIPLPAQSDELFPMMAIQYLGPLAGLVFVIGLISAAYPSADGALTALTTSFCIDFLGLPKNEKLCEKQKTRIRYMVHISFALLLLLCILLFSKIYDRALIDKLFTIAGYTYGPLLGLYSFGLFTKFDVRDKWVPLVAVLSPVICYIISMNSVQWLGGYKFGFELLILNGMLTFAGLLILRKKRVPPAAA